MDSETLAFIGRVQTSNWVEVTGHRSLRRLELASFAEGRDPKPEIATTQQLVVADALTETGNIWLDAVSNVTTSGHGSVLQRQDAVHAIKSNYYQPYTYATCASDVIQGPQDDSVVAFPYLAGQGESNDTSLDPGITKIQILSTPGPLTESRLKWVELPRDPFNASAVGAVILLPRSTVNLTQEIIVCNLGAGWGASLINESSFGGGTTFTTSVIDFSDIPNSSPVNHSNFDATGVTQAESDASGSIIAYYAREYP